MKHFIQKRFQDELDDFVVFIEFENEEAVKQLEIHDNFFVKLSKASPFNGDHILYDQNYSDIQWNPEDLITEEKFYQAWNSY